MIFIKYKSSFLIVERSSKFPKFISQKRHVRILIEVWKKPGELEIVKYKIAQF